MGGLPVGALPVLPVGGSPAGLPGALPVGAGLGMGAVCAACPGAAPVRVTRAGFGVWLVKFLDMNVIWRRTRSVPRIRAKYRAMAQETRSARAVALSLLEEVLGRRRPLDDALAGDQALAALSLRDRAFARRLVATLLRRLGQIDDLIERCLERPLKPRLAGVRDLLL